MEREEELLIRRAQRGNLLAFEQLVRKYDKQVLNLIVSMINELEDAKDVYQEVFLRVYRSIGKFQFKSEFYTWLYRIVINYCINFRKRRARYQFYSIDEQLEGEENYWTVIVRDDRDPENEVLNSELNYMITEALDTLPAKQRTVFILRHYHGHKLAEIAQIMNCSTGTVKNYLFRAIQKMKKSLQSYKEI